MQQTIAIFISNMRTKYEIDRDINSVDESAEYVHLSDSIDKTEEVHAQTVNSMAIGEVVNLTTSSGVSRVPVRWKNENGVLIFRELLAANGLQLQNGDNVILSKPGNFAQWIITGVLPQEDMFNSPHNALSQTNPMENKVVASVDGTHIEITGKDEIVLKCGDASITLRRNGRVVINGTYIETRSKGTNRIKGGSVQIN